MQSLVKFKLVRTPRQRRRGSRRVVVEDLVDRHDRVELCAAFQLGDLLHVPAHAVPCT